MKITLVALGVAAIGGGLGWLRMHSQRYPAPSFTNEYQLNNTYTGNASRRFAALPVQNHAAAREFPIGFHNRIHVDANGLTLVIKKTRHSIPWPRIELVNLTPRNDKADKKDRAATYQIYLKDGEPLFAGRSVGQAAIGQFTLNMLKAAAGPDHHDLPVTRPATIRRAEHQPGQPALLDYIRAQGVRVRIQCNIAD